MKTLLLTGFEPFLSFTLNPTMKIVEELNGQHIGDFQIVGKTMTVDFKSSGEQLISFIKEVKPDAIISLGLAGGRSKITLERIAINIKDGAADNEGNIPVDEMIQLDGPAGYMSTLPIRLMVEKLRELGYPASISNTAGTYLCNNVMYEGLHYVQTNDMDIPSGFIHIPASHALAIEHGDVPSWSHDDLKSSISGCISVLSDSL
ncbi:pyroglutamyl-peptidase I [Paenisporosarcina indica]|uniref:pyroglutamyl-peptidase I n=1 Tax=Paenisporosarcina indica TaxID=650093 RepID=UPI0009501769|nr:pyroglutamyl-peptidase I [Paenisporosarcina indica]